MIYSNRLLINKLFLNRIKRVNIKIRNKVSYFFTVLIIESILERYPTNWNNSIHTVDIIMTTLIENYNYDYDKHQRYNIKVVPFIYNYIKKDHGCQQNQI